LATIKLCECGNPVDGIGNAAKYCTECKKKIRKEQKKQYRKEYDDSNKDPDYQGIKFDCIYKVKDKMKCDALKRLYCKFENCNFYNPGR